jgi:hypothetical protein
VLENKADFLELVVSVEQFSRLRFLRLLRDIVEEDSVCRFLARDAAVAPLTSGTALEGAFLFFFFFFVFFPFFVDVCRVGGSECLFSDFIVFGSLLSERSVVAAIKNDLCLVESYDGDYYFVVLLSSAILTYHCT